METSEHFHVDGAVISQNTPITETIMASSNNTLVNIFHKLYKVVFFINCPIIGNWEVVNSGTF